jgi:hypothetical protein
MNSHQCSHPTTKELFTLAFTKNGIVYLCNEDNSVRLVSTDRAFKKIIECINTDDYFIMHVEFEDDCIQENYIICHKTNFVTAETGTYRPIYIGIGNEYGGNPEFDKDNIGIVFENKNNRTVIRYTLDEIYSNKEKIYHTHFMEQVYYDFHQNSYLKNKITQYCNNTKSDNDCDTLIDFLFQEKFSTYEVFMGDLGNDMAQEEIGSTLLQIKGIHHTKNIYKELEQFEMVEGVELNVVFDDDIKFTFMADKKKDFYKTELRILRNN